jgi:hypothetical protein
MKQRHNIIQELTELQSVLAPEGYRNVYQAPPSYFDNLADEMLKRVKAMEADSVKDELETLSPLLGSLSKKMPHSVPAGYFERLGTKLEQIASSNTEQSAPEELESLSLLLTSLKNKQTYTIPVGYFDNLLPLANTGEANPETKVVSMASRKWVRYAAAAAIIAFVATVGFFALNNKNDNINPDEKSYAWVERSLKKVSTDDINKFVELASAETTDIVKLEPKQEISNLLKDVSDKEIQEFLNDTQLTETGTDDDLILN